ncbi:MAG: hypothetical protein ACHQ1H_10785 [Nitrososphaerales archaeon]
MPLLRRTLFFFRYNWGAIFILAFMSLIVASAAYLSLGYASDSNICATFGFYFLVAGVLLQIASYLVYGNKQYIDYVTPSSSTNRRFEITRKYKIIGAILLGGVILLVIGVSIFPSSVTPIVPPIIPPNIFTSTTSNQGPFHANIFFAKVFAEPGNETLVSFGVSANGAPLPYTFKATWSDGVVQSNDYGTFSRTIQEGQSVPSYATVVVTSSNNQIVSITVQTPVANVSTSKTGYQNVSSITFLETGLPSHSAWSIQLNGSQKASQNNTLVFPNLNNGRYRFDVSYQFNGNFSSAFSFTPSKGIILVNGSAVVQNVTFSQIPANGLLTPSATANASVVNNSVTITFAYKNNLPTSLEASVIGAVNDSSGHLVTISTATLDLNANSTSSAKIFLVSLSPGKYSVSLYALYENQIVSTESQISFTVK